MFVIGMLRAETLLLCVTTNLEKVPNSIHLLF